MASNPQPLEYTVPMSLLQQVRTLPAHVTLEPLVNLAESKKRNRSPAPEIEGDARRITSTGRRHGRKRVGRKISKVNQVLQAFFREQTSETYQPPKLENVRYRVMRTLKKVVRRLDVGLKLNKTGLLSLEYSKGLPAVAFSQFVEYLQSKREKISEFAEISNGPKVDKGKKKGELESKYFTYNNSYLRHIFRSVEIRSVYQLFLRFIFSDSRPNSLVRRFKIWCCINPTHDAICTNKWLAFRELLDQYLGADLPEEILEEELPISSDVFIKQIENRDKSVAHSR